METVSSSIPECTESQIMDAMIENYAAGAFRQAHSEPGGVHLPRFVRSFGSVDPHSVLSSSSDREPGFSSDSAFAASHGRAEDFLKLEPGPWVEVSDSLALREPGGDVQRSAVLGNFVKSERDPALLSSSDFSLTASVAALDVPSASLSSDSQLLDSAAELMTTGALCLEPCSSAVPLACKTEPPGAWSPHLPLPAALSADTAGQLGLSAPNAMHSAGFIQRSPLFNSYPSVHAQRVCRICGDEASGCHYGVVTCGSCKVFFKRAVEGHHNYLCAGRNDCIVDKIRRKNCPACRLRKCYQAGMMLGGRRLKRYGVVKPVGMDSSMMFQGHSLASMPCMPSIQELHLLPQFLNILESIEPETVYAGYDSSQLDLPHLLLSSLNQLCERQLLWIVKWSKNLPGFRRLHINDQMTLIQYSWMNLMVFSLGWRSFQNVTLDYMYFAPDLILSHDRMRQTPIYELCQTMQFIPQEFTKLQVTKEEFLCMKALMLLNTVPLKGLTSQIQFDEMRQNYISELTRAIRMKEKGLVESSQRFYHLTKLMDSMHEIVKKVNLYCLSTFIQADAMRVEFPEMMSEVIASQLPNVLAGMVRPLLFHSQ